MLIPKVWLGDATEVELVVEAGKVVLIARTDPIFTLGTQPVTTGVADASENLDEYLQSP